MRNKGERRTFRSKISSISDRIHKTKSRYKIGAADELYTRENRAAYNTFRKIEPERMPKVNLKLQTKRKKIHEPNKDKVE
jgi:hypothetical protein